MGWLRKGRTGRLRKREASTSRREQLNRAESWNNRRKRRDVGVGTTRALGERVRTGESYEEQRGRGRSEARKAAKTQENHAKRQTQRPPENTRNMAHAGRTAARDARKCKEYSDGMRVACAADADTWEQTGNSDANARHRREWWAPTDKGAGLAARAAYHASNVTDYDLVPLFQTL